MPSMNSGRVRVQGGINAAPEEQGGAIPAGMEHVG